MTATPYLTVTDLERELTVQRIDAPLTIRPGMYRVQVEGAWTELDAVEPRITTGAAPIRALQLRASGTGVSDLLRLHAELRDGGGPLHMETPERRAFDVAFQDLRSTLFLSGTFHRDREEPEIEYRISLQGKELMGIAIDRERDGRRGLLLTDLAFDDEDALVRAFTSRWSLVVEQIA